MPTAAQFKVHVHANKKPRAGWGEKSGGWVGGAWRTRFGSQKPTKGDPGWMMSKDGRAWTPGPGRYSDGNPKGSSVRYEMMKYSFFAGTLDVQKPRWPGDGETPTLSQAGGVVVNPVRGFSMGTGFSPGQTLVRNYEKVGKRTKGFGYQGQAPDLNMGKPSVSTRGPAPGQAARPAGGPRPGTRFVPPSQPTHPSCQVFNTTHGTAHMRDPNAYPGPGNYGSDYTFSNIGTLDNPVGRVTGHEFPPAFDFGKAQQRPSVEDSGVPGPNTYDTDAAFPNLTQYVPGKGHYITSKSIGGKMLGDRRADPAESSDGPGPAAYQPEGGFDCLAHLRRSDFCEIKYVDPTAEKQREEDETPGPQSYDLSSNIQQGMALRTGRQHALGGDKALGFGSRWAGWGEDRSDMPGPGKYLIHEPVWTGGMAPQHPAWTIPHGERPPLNPPSAGPGPAGYEGMGEIRVTHEGEVFVGDARASGTLFAKSPRGSLLEGGEGSNKLYLPRTTRDGGVMVGDERSEGVKIPQGPRGATWEERTGEGADRLYLLPDPFREDLRFEWEPFKSVPRQDGPLAHHPRARRQRPTSAPVHRRSASPKKKKAGGGSDAAAWGGAEGGAAEAGDGARAEKEEEHGDERRATAGAGVGGWGGAEFATMRAVALEDGEVQGTEEDAIQARQTLADSTEGGVRGGEGEREAGREEAREGTGQLREGKERRDEGKVGSDTRAAGGKTGEKRKKKSSKGTERTGLEASWFPELDFEAIAQAEGAVAQEEGAATLEEGARGGDGEVPRSIEEAAFAVEEGRRRVVYDTTEEERMRGGGGGEAETRFEVERGRRRVAPSSTQTRSEAAASEEGGEAGGSVAAREGVGFATASDLEFGGGGGFTWTEGQGRRRRGPAASASASILAAPLTGGGAQEDGTELAADEEATDADDGEGSGEATRSGGVRRRRRARGM